MRVPRIRFTVRGYMIAVAVSTTMIVLGLQITRLVGLRRVYLENAGQHEIYEEIEQERLSAIAHLRGEGFPDDPSIPAAEKLTTLAELTAELPGFDPERELAAIEGLASAGNEDPKNTPSIPVASKLAAIEGQSRAVLKWHHDMKQKWQRAADHPWESVPRDNPNSFLKFVSQQTQPNQP